MQNIIFSFNFGVKYDRETHCKQFAQSSLPWDWMKNTWTGSGWQNGHSSSCVCTGCSAVYESLNESQLFTGCALCFILLKRLTNLAYYCSQSCCHHHSWISGSMFLELFELKWYRHRPCVSGWIFLAWKHTGKEVEMSNKKENVYSVS